MGSRVVIRKGSSSKVQIIIVVHRDDVMDTPERKLVARTIFTTHIKANVISQTLNIFRYLPLIHLLPLHFRKPKMSSPDWKSSNRHLNILSAAEKGKYGVLACIAYNIEHILGFVRAAEKA